MKKFNLFILSLSLLLSACNTPNVSIDNSISNNSQINSTNKPKSDKRNGDVIDGEFIIKFKDSTRASSEILSTYGKINQLGKTGMFLLSTEKEKSNEVFRTLSKNSNIKFIEPNLFVRVELINPMPGDILTRLDAVSFPNDEFFSQQYSHRVTNSQDGWKISQGSNKTVIAIVDTGVDGRHPDLKDKMVEGYNVQQPSFPSSAIFDPFGHGTHCAGIAAASTNNGIGVSGVAPNSKIMPVRVLDENGEGSSANVAEGIVWASDNNADVISLSLGGPKKSQAVADAVEYAIKNNSIVVAAMGNEGDESQCFPAALSGVIAVGSTNERDLKSGFSQFGSWISVTAPGTDILSTFPTYSTAMDGKNYGKISGTSMATPFVAGLASLIKGYNPNLTPSEVRKAIENGADDLGDKGFDKFFGFGRVNIAKSLKIAGTIRK